MTMTVWNLTEYTGFGYLISRWSNFLKELGFSLLENYLKVRLMNWVDVYLHQVELVLFLRCCGNVFGI